MADRKLSFAFTAGDIRLIEKIKREMSKTQGKVTNIAAIRRAIRSEAGK
jgi:hypothetical protein